MLPDRHGKLTSVLHALSKELEHSIREVKFATRIVLPMHCRFAPVKLRLLQCALTGLGKAPGQMYKMRPNRIYALLSEFPGARSGALGSADGDAS